MGAMKLLLLLLLVLSNFNFPASYAQIANSYTEKSRIDDFGAYARMKNNGILKQSKFARAGARGGAVTGAGAGGGGGGGGGHSTRGNYGNGGESVSSQRGGGGAVIPVYAAAGAASKPNNHHNAANTHSWCRKDRILIVIASGLTSLLLRVYI